MKRFLIFLASIALIGCVFYIINLALYQPEKEFFDFPVPKSAKLVKETEHSNIYKWSKASEENGIPIGYRLILKKDGWKPVDKEGALTHYKKDTFKVDLISTKGQLSITRDK